MKRPSFLLLGAGACSVLLAWSIIKRIAGTPSDERFFEIGMLLVCCGMGLFFSWLFLKIGDAMGHQKVAGVILKVCVTASAVLGMATVALGTINELAPELSVAVGSATTLLIKSRNSDRKERCL